MQDKVLTQATHLMQLISFSSQFSLKKLSDLDRKGEDRPQITGRNRRYDVLSDVTSIILMVR